MVNSLLIKKDLREIFLKLENLKRLKKLQWSKSKQLDKLKELIKEGDFNRVLY